MFSVRARQIAGVTSLVGFIVLVLTLMQLNAVARISLEETGSFLGSAVVAPGESGFLCEVKSGASLAQACRDAYSRRTAFALWIVWVADLATPGIIVVILLFSGVASGINIAAWQSFVAR